MILPDGRDCKFFYANYYRGRNFEECRALTSQEDKREWKIAFCDACPLPDYLRNNSCENIVYSVFVAKSLFKKKIKVKAWCQLVHEPVDDPNIGCGHCHRTP
jgi:hypothetical protein